MEKTNNVLEKIQINYYLFWILTVTFLLAISASFFFAFNTENILQAKATKYEEAIRPANLNITIINDKDCAECYPLDGVVHSLKQQNIKVTAENTLEYSNTEAKSLIVKYQIESLPALIVTGEINKDESLTKFFSNLGQSDEDTFILRHKFYPYKDLVKNKVRGKTQIYLLSDENCKECYDVRQHLSILANYGLDIKSATTTDINSELGKDLVKRYKIEKSPTFVLTGDVDVFDNLKKVWPQVGTIEDDGSYVFRSGLDSTKVTYKNLSTGEIINVTSSTTK